MDLPPNDLIAWRISEYLWAAGYFAGHEGNMYNAVDWLSLCSGLENVSIGPSKYDDGVLYCGRAWDHSEARSALISELNTALVRFHFAWGALESMIPEFVPAEKIDKHGKINALCGFLKTKALRKTLPMFYVSVYERFVDLLRYEQQYRPDIRNLGLENNIKFEFKDHVDIAGAGIYVVYRIRNRFAHGMLRFPEPEEYCGKPSYDMEIIRNATTIVLMTMIMLLIGDIKENDFLLDEMLYTDGDQHAVPYLIKLCGSIDEPDPAYTTDLFDLCK